MSKATVAVKISTPRVYELLAKEPVTIKPPQANTILTIIRESVKDGKVDEVTLKAQVEAGQSRLKTRQPAWRIFQYYRAGLIAAKFIKHN